MTYSKSNLTVYVIVAIKITAKAIEKIKLFEFSCEAIANSIIMTDANANFFLIRGYI